MIEHIFIYIILITFISSEKIILFSKSTDISINVNHEYSIDLNKIKGDEYHSLRKSILSIEVTSITSYPHPIILLTNINKEAKINNYDKIDVLGIFSNKKYIHNIQYSPCEISKNDIINIKLMCQQSASYTIEIYILKTEDFQINCPEFSNQTVRENLKNNYTGMDITINGLYQFGGISNKDLLLHNDLYYLDNNGKWNYIEVYGIKPSPRHGMFMIAFDSQKFLLVLGGKDIENKYINDLWVYDINDIQWLKIGNYENIVNFPKDRFLPNGINNKNHGIILLYGGMDTKDNNLYIIDISILKEIVRRYKNEEDYSNLLEELIKKHFITEQNVFPRYGASMTQIDKDEVLLFGGIDSESNSTIDYCDIINLLNYDIERLNYNLGEAPSPRAFHTTERYGPMFLLYGGKESNENVLNDMYKFIINDRKWIKIKYDDIEFINYFQEEYFFLTDSYIFKNKERPMIISQHKKNNDIIILNFPICKSDIDIKSDKYCLPCHMGYENYEMTSCKKCTPGTFFFFEDEYSEGKCKFCPRGTYNPYYSMTDQSSCLLCHYNTFNNEVGKSECKDCEFRKSCLIGSTSSISYFDIDESMIEEESYLNIDNYPEFIDQNNLMEYLSIRNGIIIIITLTTLVIVILLSCYKCNRENTIKRLCKIDFIPLTGGNNKKTNGGFITIIYSILIISLSLSFILRYILWNNIVEISSFESEKGISKSELESSIQLEIDIFGEHIPCLSEKERKRTEFGNCHSKISFLKNGLSFYDEDTKLLQCKIMNENQCRIIFNCEDCKDKINNKDTFNLIINDESIYISLYKWTFKNYWDKTFYNINKKKGHSFITGIFKANDDIINNRYVFKGDEKPSKISLMFSPVYYNIQNLNEKLIGQRMSLNSYEKGSIRNQYTFNNPSKGVKLDFHFIVNQNANIVNVKKDISILDFFAFLLGILAGFAFLSRVTKYIFETCEIMNYSEEGIEKFNKLEEENDDKQIELANQK